jgi:hypothetical protein
MTNLSIGTNGNNDIYLGADGNMVMVSGVDAVKQDAEHALKAQFGEMFLQPTDGMPATDDVFLDQQFARYQAVGIKTLKNINGIVSVLSFVIIQDGDTMKYTAVFTTVYSTTQQTLIGLLI